jgi:hypothetical protein
MVLLGGIAKCPFTLKKAAPQHCVRVCKMAVQLGFFKELKYVFGKVNLSC